MCDKLRQTVGSLALDLSYFRAIRFLQLETGDALQSCIRWANTLAQLDPESRLAMTKPL